MARPRGGRAATWWALILVSALTTCAWAAPKLSIYGKLPGFQMAALSDSGEHIAIVGEMNDERRLIVLDKNFKTLISAPLGNAKIRGLYWAGDEYVLLYKSETRPLSALQFSAPKAELFSMIVIPLNGQKDWVVFAKSRTITGGVSGFYGLRKQQGKYFGYFGGITIERDTYHSEYLQSTHPVLYEVNLADQSVRKVAPRLDSDGYRQWIVGPDGEVSATLDFLSKGGDWSIHNRSGKKIMMGTDPYATVRLIGLGATTDTIIYSRDDDESGEERRVELSLGGGEEKPILDDVKIKRTMFDPHTRQMMGYEIDGDTPAYKFLDAHRQKAIDGTVQAFPGVSVHLIEWNEEFDKLIVVTEGELHPQTWWLVDVKTGQAKSIGASYTLRPAEVAPTRIIHYDASDGLEVAAVLTLPPGVPAKSLPVVALPHGGPHARDYAGFDWWAQAFASRGYAVLQPNFRGSSGYGAQFERAGYGEWGRKMQTDISEGLTYLAKQGIVDGKRACIVGGSYGGYAALAGVTLQKGIYRCAVAYAAVSDVAEFVATETRERYTDATLRRALKQEVGSGKDLREVSPINFAASADAPILLIHGKDDIVVHYEQSVAMADALRKAGKPVEFVTLPDEDHWLSKSETRLAMLEAALTFVEKHNPSESKP